MFVDASAIVAILDREPDAQELAAKIAGSRDVFYSALSQFEAARGLARLQTISVQSAASKIADLMEAAEAQSVPLTVEVSILAIDAHDRFGKGNHPACLNMGDCFAYACAKLHRVPLLCKGNDFIHTDIKIA
jgi:ribonuclease VapC